MQGRSDHAGDVRWATLGELDWLTALHQLLYEEDAYLSAYPANVDNALIGIGGAPTRNTTLPKDDSARKAHPVASGFLDYFPDAIPLIAHLSFMANEKHNPGQPMHWARGKSTDEPDTMMRHFLARGTFDDDGFLHDVKIAWRALANLQKEIERRKAAGLPICQTKYYNTGSSEQKFYRPVIRTSPFAPNLPQEEVG